jgi:integrase/recombinase XerD
MLELMAKGGMRIGEVLKIRPVNVKDRKITLPDPKSGRDSEIVYIPQKIADRLRDYIQDKGIEPEKRIFPITYNAARVMVKKAGELAGVNLRPHDLMRHAPMHPDLELQLRLSVRSSSDTPIYRLLSDIWER